MVEPSPLSSAADTPPDTRPYRRRTSSLMLALLGLVVLCAIGIFGYVTQSGVESSRAWVLHTYDVRSALQNLETQLAEARANALAFASSGDETQLKDFRAHSVNTERVLQDLRGLTADNERQQYRLAEMEVSSRKYLLELESMAPWQLRGSHGIPLNRKPFATSKCVKLNKENSFVPWPTTNSYCSRGV
jgi:CHASE3 domain sensor protein